MKKNQSLNEKILSKTKRVERLEEQITKQGESISLGFKTALKKEEELHLDSLENEFELAINRRWVADDCAVTLMGEKWLELPSRHEENMHLMWGDTVKYTIIGNHRSIGNFFPPTRRVSSPLMLVVGENEYPLYSTGSENSNRREFDVYGPNNRPMKVKIFNPEKVRNIIIKISIETTDSKRGQEKFRKMVLSSPILDYAKKVYLQTTDDLNFRAEPSRDSRVKRVLAAGSFVKRLQENEGWIEVLTPRGDQGWVHGLFLESIN